MAGEVATGLVLFISAVAVAGLAAAAMTHVVGGMAGELRERGEGLSAALSTGIAIVNDPVRVPYAAGELTLYVKNTGSRTLITEELTVFVDGVHRSFTAELLDGETSWRPGVVAKLTVSVTLASGDHRAHAVYTPNIADGMDFRV